MSGVAGKSGRRCKTTHDRAAMIEFIKQNPDEMHTDVAALFDCSVGTAQKVYHQLFPGRVKAKRPRKFVSRNPHVLQVVEYAEAHPGAPTKEIAGVVQMDPKRVSVILNHAGLGSGKQGKYRGYEQRPDFSLNSPESDRARILKQSMDEDWTLQDTATLLGVTRERVRQLRKRYQQEYGITSRTKLRLPEVAKTFKVRRDVLRRVAIAAGLGKPRGEAGMTFDPSELTKLEEAVLLAYRRKCPSCQQVFFIDPTTGNRQPGQPRPRIYCSGDCQRASLSAKFKYSNPERPSACEEPHRLKQWKGLVLYLNEHRRQDTDYITMKQARELTGATTMQLAYLRYRRVLRVRPSPSGRTRNGVPHHEVALADVLALRDYMQGKIPA